MNSGNSARSSLIYGCVCTKEDTGHTRPHTHPQTSCSLFSFGSTLSMSFTSHCPDKWGEQEESTLIENWKLNVAHSPFFNECNVTLIWRRFSGVYAVSRASCVSSCVNFIIQRRRSLSDSCRSSSSNQYQIFWPSSSGVRAYMIQTMQRGEGE